jgi:hypothetical protein
MRQYGKQKTAHKVSGHGHWCYICVPDMFSKVGRTQARRQGKREIEEQLQYEIELGICVLCGGETDLDEEYCIDCNHHHRYP